MALEGFETISFGNSGVIASITKNGVTFNKSTALKLGSPQSVVLLLNKEKKQFAIKAAGTKDVSPMPFCNSEKPSPSVRWSSKEFLRLLSGMMGWNLRTNNGYKVVGMYNSADKAIVFDLNDATPNP